MSLTMTAEHPIEDVLANSEASLHSVVKTMIEAPDLFDYLRESTDKKESIRQRTRELIAAFSAGDEDARAMLHKTLSALYEVHIYGPDKRPVHNQYDPMLMEVQRDLEEAWDSQETGRIPDLDIPEDGREFADWLKQLILNHPACDHPLFTFLEHECTFDQMSDFFKQEITVDARFDDLVALAQVGTDSGAKMELAENYWDEMGDGDPKLVHTYMFDILLSELKVLNGNAVHTLLEEVDWEALASGNALLYSVLHRKNIYQALGALGALEMIAPIRFSRLVRGFKRLGLSEGAQQYHTLHIAIDARHGNGWLRNAITPLAEGNEKARRDIVKGTFYRLNTSNDHCNRLLARYTAGGDGAY